jgi:ketopantoate reductase
LPGGVAARNPYVAAAKFVMRKMEPEQEARKVAQAIASEITKFMAAQGIPTLKATRTR